MCIRDRRRLAAAAAVAAVLLATPALAVRSETGYAVLYRIAPAVAQFFQPVQEACTDSGITMEVAAVRVEGDTAQAYIVLSGGPVDATTAVSYTHLDVYKRQAYDAEFCRVLRQGSSPHPVA